MNGMEKYIKLKGKQAELVRKLNRVNSSYESKIDDLKKAKRVLKIKKLVPYALSLGISLFGTKILTGGYPFITDQKEAYECLTLDLGQDGKIYSTKKDYIRSNSSLPDNFIGKIDLEGNGEKTTYYEDPGLTVYDFQKAISEGKLEELFATFKVSDEKIHQGSYLLSAYYPMYIMSLHEVDKKDTILVDEKYSENYFSNFMFILLLMLSTMNAVSIDLSLRNKIKGINEDIEFNEEEQKQIVEELTKKLTKVENKITGMDFTRKK